MTDVFYATGFREQTIEGDECVATGSVALTYDRLIEQIAEDGDVIEEFEAATGRTPEVYKLFPVGNVRDFAAKEV